MRRSKSPCLNAFFSGGSNRPNPERRTQKIFADFAAPMIQPGMGGFSGRAWGSWLPDHMRSSAKSGPRLPELLWASATIWPVHGHRIARFGCLPERRGPHRRTGPPWSHGTAHSRLGSRTLCHCAQRHGRVRLDAPTASTAPAARHYPGEEAARSTGNAGCPARAKVTHGPSGPAAPYRRRLRTGTEQGMQASSLWREVCP